MSGFVSLRMSLFSFSISVGSMVLICCSMKGMPPRPASGFVRFSRVCWVATISSPGLAAAYTSFPCQWSQWKCVLMILRTGFLVTAWISLYSARAAEGFEWESTTITPSSVMITAALQLSLYRVSAMAAYTPSATFLSWKSSLSAVWAWAGRTQQISWGSRVWTAAAAIPIWVSTCRRVHCFAITSPPCDSRLGGVLVDPPRGAGWRA